MANPLLTTCAPKYNNSITRIGLVFVMLLGLFIPDAIKGGSTSEAFENLELLLMVYPVLLLISFLIIALFRDKNKIERIRSHINIFLVVIWILAYFLITSLQYLLRLDDSTPGIHESDVFIILSLLFFIICFKILGIPIHFRRMATLLLYLFVVLLINMFCLNSPINYSWMHTDDIVFLSSYYICNTMLMVIYYYKSLSSSVGAT